MSTEPRKSAETRAEPVCKDKATTPAESCTELWKGGSFGEVILNPLLANIKALWAEVLKFEEAAQDPDCPGPDAELPARAFEVANFSIKMLKSKRRKGKPDWIYTVIRLLRQMTKLQEGVGQKIGKELLLKEDTIKFLLVDCMTVDPRDGQLVLEDRAVAEICILYHNCYFLNPAFSEEMYSKLSLWKSVADRLTRLEKTPLDLNHLFGFTRLLFIIGAGQSDEGKVIRKELATHPHFVHFLVHAFNKILKGEFWLSDKKCRAVSDIIKVLYNLTLHDREFILTSLDKQPFEKETIATVMRILKLPLDADPSWSMEKASQVEDNCLAHVKLELVNLLMNTPKVLTVFFGTDPKELDSLGQLLTFRVKSAMSSKELIPTLAPILMLFEATCKLGPKEIQEYWKSYVFGEDATNGRKPDNPKDIGGLRTAEEGTLRNNLLDLMLHVDFTIKSCSGKFLLAACAEDEAEFVRLTGLGNAVGTLHSLGRLPTLQTTKRPT